MPQTDPVLAFVIVLYAFVISWVAERFGAFQDLSPTVKQLVVALAGFAVPLVVQVVTGVFGAWPDTIGTPEGLTQALFALAAPFAVWLITQVAHYADLALARLVGNR
jgi:hypothetical protein